MLLTGNMSIIVDNSVDMDHTGNLRRRGGDESRCSLSVVVNKKHFRSVISAGIMGQSQTISFNMQDFRTLNSIVHGVDKSNGSAQILFKSLS